MQNQFYDDIYNFIYENLVNEVSDKTDSGTVIKAVSKTDFFDYILYNDNLDFIDIITHITSNRIKLNDFLQSIESHSNDIIDLCKKHFILISENLDTESLLLKLFKECKNICLLYPVSSHKYAINSKTVDSTLGRELHAENLKSLLEQHHKIILLGEHGSGKTRFVNYCLHKWKKTDYCYINYSNNLTSTLQQGTYIDYLDIPHNVNLSAFSKYNFLTSLLIIDNICFSSDATKDIEELEKLNVDIIVIATKHIDNNMFYSYELPQLSNDDLENIFKNESNLNIDSYHFEQLLTQTWQNPFLISLIAKQCKHEKTDINSLDNILKYLKQPDKKIKLQKFKHSYHNIPVNFMGHIKCVYTNILKNCKFDNKDKIIQQLKYLCCFGCSPILVSFISSVFPNYDESFYDKLSQMELIEYSSEVVQVPPLIFYAVWAEENFKPDQEDLQSLCKKLCDFLMCYDTTLSIPYLSTLLLSFAQNLYDNVSITNNPKQKKTSKYFEIWQDLLSLIFNYYNQTGGFQLASETASLIHYPEKVQNRHTPLDKDLFHLSNNISLFPISDADNIIKEIDKICLSPIISTAYLTDITITLINSLDKAIKSYCNLLFSYVTNPNNPIENEQQHYANILGMLLSKTFDQTSSTTMKLFFQKFCVNLDERLKYYKGCHTLMGDPIVPPENLHKHCSELRTWKNANYRIRSIAFFVFVHNFYWFKNTNTNPDIIRMKLLPQFNSTVIPEIKYLYDQIHNCKLIPHETCYICLCCCISTALVQYTFLPDKSENLPFDFYKNYLKELSRRAVLYEEDLSDVITSIDKAFSLIK